MNRPNNFQVKDKEITEYFDSIIIGAGAAGFMAAITAAKRSKKVLLIDHSKKIAEKIRISGGGRCNFTNLYASPENYISENPHFCKSALSRYRPEDFLAWVEENGIGYHEKKLGQLFCDKGSGEIISLLVNEARKYKVEFLKELEVWGIDKNEEGCFEIRLKDKNSGDLFKKFSTSLVLATGGLSIPKLGTSDLAYRIAKKFGHRIVEPRPGLVPLVFNEEFFRRNAGQSFYVSLSIPSKVSFEENILFTHKGLSGPAILQISSYLRAGDSFLINLLPFMDLYDYLLKKKNSGSKKKLKNIFLEIEYPDGFHEKNRSKLNKKNVFSEEFLMDFFGFDLGLDKLIAEISNIDLKRFSEKISSWKLIPNANEGFDKAEVTVGGIDTQDLNSKSMESKLVRNLYFIGEAVDVTGHLGGYNFQWAWSSGFVAGISI